MYLVPHRETREDEMDHQSQYGVYPFLPHLQEAKIKCPLSLKWLALLPWPPGVPGKCTMPYVLGWATATLSAL